MKNLIFHQKDIMLALFRDTEGHDLISPKLSKGPDQFVQVVKYLNSIKNNLQVILTGKRRDYIMNQLDIENIPYKYFEMISFEKINKLYNLLDLYIVSSRYEGGPQSIFRVRTHKNSYHFNRCWDSL